MILKALDAITVSLHGPNGGQITGRLGCKRRVCVGLVNRPDSQTPGCTCSISHNAGFRTELCTFLFWIEHCGIWNRICEIGLLEVMPYTQLAVPQPPGWHCVAVFGSVTKWRARVTAMCCVSTGWRFTLHGQHLLYVESDFTRYCHISESILFMATETCLSQLPQTRQK